MKRWQVLLILGFVVAAAGVAAFYPGAAVTDCTPNQSDRYASDRRECLWDAYQAQQPARFESLILTDAGDPVVTRVRVGKGRLEAEVGTTREIIAYRCRALERRVVLWRGIDMVDFRLTGCTGGPQREIDLGRN